MKRKYIIDIFIVVFGILVIALTATIISTVLFNPILTVIVGIILLVLLLLVIVIMFDAVNAGCCEPIITEAQFDTIEEIEDYYEYGITHSKE